MMAIGDRRFLFQLVFPGESWDFLRAEGQILDVTDPLQPIVISRDAFRAFSINLAWHAKSERWILMESQTTFGGPASWAPGPRGVGFSDVTDPTEPKPISGYSADGGDPTRIWQTGSGTHRDFWDGGRYAYLGTGQEDAHFPERTGEKYSRSLQILDVDSIENPTLAGEWWVPGQKTKEEEARRQWRSHGDPRAYDTFHGPEYVPLRIEDGGRYGYGGWGTFGLLIHDLSDPGAPRLVGQWDTPEYLKGPMMPHHTADVTRIDRGFVITSPESLATECQEGWHDTWIVEVRDPTQPKALAPLPVPKPPPEAPYEDFCAKPGRFGPHNAPHLKAPGRPHPNFTYYAYFNGGLQGFDITDPTDPKIASWFVPAQAGRIDSPESYERSADSVFVEWDRKLIWLATNNGLYLLSTPDLGTPVTAPLPVTVWSLPGLNVGHP